ncbi:MAG: nucleotide pyrophosphohydrolase [Deltaproteobacteria bacterium]|nr:nucleotide pyrophosphohydrolase [Deltaproteobacteria bacterium]
MDITELHKNVIEFREERDWAQYHNPKDLAISLSLEAAELLEIFQWKNDIEVEAVKNDTANREKVKEELGDILIYTLDMCDVFGLDPADVILSKLKINEERYPVGKARGSSKKYTQYQNGT